MSRGIGKVIVIIIVILGIIFVGFFGYKYMIMKTTPTNSTNVTTITYINITQENTTVVEKGSVWNTLTVVGIVTAICALLFGIFFLLFNSATGRKTFNDTKMEKAIQFAVKELQTLQKHFHKIPVWKYPYYQGDNIKYPHYAFIFLHGSEEVNTPIEQVHKHNLISLHVNAQTLDVFDVQTDKDSKDIKRELNAQRDGKIGVLNVPEKAQKETTLSDVISGGNVAPQINITTEGYEE